MKLSYFFVFALIFPLSCDRIPDYSSNNRQSNHISIEEALNNLNLFIQQTGITTKATTEDFTLDVLGSSNIYPNTKATTTPTDTSLYLLNFKDGFAVLSAKRSLKMPIVCFSDKGHLTIEDFANAQSIESSVGDSIFNAEKQFVPTLLLPLIGSGDDDDEEYPIEWDPDPIDPGPTTGLISRISYLPFLQTKWHQMGVFCQNTPNNYPACCVVIALCQIIVKNKYSNCMTFDNVTCDFDTLATVHHYSDPTYSGSTNGGNQASHFVKVLGDEYHCNVQYGFGLSTSNTYYASQTMSSLGYDSVTIHSSLAFTNDFRDIIKSSLQKGYPVYTDGLCSSDLGHAWVIDGYLREVYEHNYIVEVFHINWGWKGSRDGYYNVGIFNTSNRRGKSPVDAFIIDEGEHQNFTWNYHVITYSHN